MTKHKDKLRICLAASGGGHLTELLTLSDSWKGYDTFWVTTRAVVAKKLKKNGKVYVVGECNRQHLLRTICVFVRCIGVVLRERPDVVISTGAAVGCMLSFLGKMLGARVIWVDSIANVERLSLSGRLTLPVADLCLTQWKELANQYKKVEYAGTIV